LKAYNSTFVNIERRNLSKHFSNLWKIA